ncbi:MAG: ascorbate-dependent monooxygenase [Verrucomicrobia bacterium]|nr:ascorbate-dependent monooxygenase [Verrucomicrobiota bacterium]
MNQRLLLGLICAATLLALTPPRAASNPKPGTAAPSPISYSPRPANTLTFSKDVAPILFSNCAVCHRTGEVAPFTLTSYADAAKRAKTIASVVGKRVMPPWKAAPGPAYVDECRLTDDQIGLIQQWAAEGVKEGNPADLPAMPKFPDGWRNGEPDLVIEMPEPYTVPAEGRDIYRNFVIPTGFTEDKWLSAVEIRPGNRRVVHHVLVHLDVSGKARELDAQDPGPGYRTGGGVGFRSAGQIGGWAPGNVARRSPDGVGVNAPKNSDIVIQVHYNLNGKPETDRTKIGLYYAKGPVDKRARLFPLVTRINIPAGDADHRVTSTMPVPADVTLRSVMPHMHLLGRDIRVFATLPGGKELPLVHVPEWDFNWQNSYVFQEPVKLPGGSKITLEASYDNSDKNPRNPNSPPKAVRWGEQTTDEMCLAYLNFTVDSESLTQGKTVPGISDYLRKAGEARKKASR